VLLRSLTEKVAADGRTFTQISPLFEVTEIFQEEEEKGQQKEDQEEDEQWVQLVHCKADWRGEAGGWEGGWTGGSRPPSFFGSRELALCCDIEQPL